MSRIFYCADCGLELELVRKALKNKMIIVDTIRAHDCLDVDKKHLSNILDDEKPPTRLQVEQRKASLIRPLGLEDADMTMFQDRRDKSILHRPAISSAPAGILGQIKGGSNTMPERTLDNLDEPGE